MFALDADGEVETRTDWLLSGLNLIAEINPTPVAVNMSFGGAYSRLLEMAAEQLAQKTILVAAAGNDGSDELMYPAAYKEVYAVGAVDANGRVLATSNRGAHVRLHAPGEDIWVSDRSGDGYYVSGTSYAAPFVSAALAQLAMNQTSINEYMQGLANGGVVDFSRLCH